MNLYQDTSSSLVHGGTSSLVYIFSFAISDSHPPFPFSASPVIGTVLMYLLPVFSHMLGSYKIYSVDWYILFWNYVLVLSHVQNFVLFLFSFISVLNLSMSLLNSFVAPNWYIGFCNLKYHISIISFLWTVLTCLCPLYLVPCHYLTYHLLPTW